MNNKVEITFELWNRFNQLKGGIDTHIVFFTKLLDVYEESLKPKESVVEPNKSVRIEKKNSINNKKGENND